MKPTKPANCYHISDNPLSYGIPLTVGLWKKKNCDVFKQQNYPQFIKEEIFEDVRKEKFPEAPSRYESVFLFPDITFAKFYRAAWNHYRSFIYEAEIISGNPYIVDMEFLNCNGASYAFIKAQAEKYWSGMYYKESCTLEILLPGQAIIGNLVCEPCIL